VGVLSYFSYGIGSNPIQWGLLASNLFNLASGTLLIILTIDFLAVGTVVRRHKFELLGFVGFTVMSRLADFTYGLQNGYFMNDALTNSGYGFYINSVVLALLGAYVALRLLSDRKILVKNTFALLSVYFTVAMLGGLYDAAFGMWNNSSTWYPLLVNRIGIVSTEIVCGVGAYFFFRTYLDMRRRPTFELSLPVYVRGSVLLYGLYELFMVVYYVLFPSPWMTPDNYGGVVSFTFLRAFSAMLPLAYVFASFHSLRFSVGEGVSKVESTPGEVA
jgi:hypothetical protein